MLNFEIGKELPVYPLYFSLALNVGIGMGLGHTLKFYARVFYVMVKALSGELFCRQTGPKVVKLFSCSTHLSMKFSLLINMKMPTNVGIFIFISIDNFTFS